LELTVTDLATTRVILSAAKCLGEILRCAQNDTTRYKTQWAGYCSETTSPPAIVSRETSKSASIPSVWKWTLPSA